MISHWPEAAVRDFPTGTFSLSEGMGLIDVLSPGVQHIMSFDIHSHPPFIVGTSQGCEDGDLEPCGTRGLEEMTF